MCTGAIINAHIDTVVYGCDDERAGCCGTAADLFALPYSHRPEVYRGFFEEECRELLGRRPFSVLTTGGGGCIIRRWDSG